MPGCTNTHGSVLRSSCIHTQEKGWQSGVRSCIMPRLPTHLVQELNVGIVASKMEVPRTQYWTLWLYTSQISYNKVNEDMRQKASTSEPPLSRRFLSTN